MSSIRGNTWVGLVRLVAPIWMAAVGVVAAAAGVIFYFAVGAVVHAFPADVPDGIVMPIYMLFVASPAFIALVVLGRVSSVLYRHDSPTLPRALLHLWHCAVLYPLAGWTLFLLVTCPDATAPMPAQCADPLGTSIAAGAVALGGILGDAITAYRRRPPWSRPPANVRCSRRTLY